ncbi:hypothetical protein BDR04DRAFT_416358 [Suillus decipiens]|nr:hypothetical protein BDR04DRAFT_416358 [Suillus decipiens]
MPQKNRRATGMDLFCTVIYFVLTRHAVMLYLFLPHGHRDCSSKDLSKTTEASCARISTKLLHRTSIAKKSTTHSPILYGHLRKYHVRGSSILRRYGKGRFLLRTNPHKVLRFKLHCPWDKRDKLSITLNIALNQSSPELS